MTIKAIETRYKGYRFRSRLEARWAVFFDALGIRWEYEIEGFKIRSRVDEDQRTWNYLPDFFLPESGAFIEVKGTLENVTSNYLEMIAWAIDWGGQLPGVEDSWGSIPARGLFWFGPIPQDNLCHVDTPIHAILQHSKGGWCNEGYFRSSGVFDVNDAASNYFDASGNSDGVLREALNRIVYSGSWCCRGRPCDPEVREAYRLARSARFEHGEGS